MATIKASNVKNRSDSELMVLLDVECGNDLGFWFPEMPATKLTSWWLDLETVTPYWMGDKILPGTVVYVDCPELRALWLAMMKSKIYWNASLHCDNDSLLGHPCGKIYEHLGFREE